MLDEKLDLKTRERWTQLYNNTSTVLNQVLKDRQMRDCEEKTGIIERTKERLNRDLTRNIDPEELGN